MTEPSEGVMSLIMKLLERANHPETPPHEAKLAEERAEQLMAKHMIDRFEAEQAAKKRGESTRKPIVDEWEVNMTAHRAKEGTDYTSANEFDHQVLDMMTYVLKHCNVRINRDYKTPTIRINVGLPSERDALDRSRRIYQIVGFREDIAYAERIWFNVFRTFVSNINPQWDTNQSIEANAYNFASAGVSWKQQVLLAETAGDTRIEWPWRFQGEDRKAPFFSSWQAGSTIDPGNEPWGRSIHKLKRAVKKYCTDNNVAYPYAGGAKLRVATRSSFARSYRQTIVTRLDEIQAKAKKFEEQSSGEKYAVALLDTKEQVDAEFYRLFPEYDPEVRRKQQEAYEYERAILWAILTPEEQRKVLREQQEEEAAWARSARRNRRNYGYVREDPSERYDAAAWARGQKAAHSVNLRNDAEVKKETKKEIG